MSDSHIHTTRSVRSGTTTSLTDLEALHDNDVDLEKLSSSSASVLNDGLMNGHIHDYTTAHTNSKRDELLTPEYFQRTKGPVVLRGPTAYLDGLRGWAAFMVYVSHHMLGAHMQKEVERGYGHGGNYYFVSIPILRNLFTGSHMAVHVFFVISGYVLSLNTLIMIRNGTSGEKIASSLASATCRRFVRLWTPIVGTTFIALLIGYALGDPFDSHTLKSNLFLQICNWFSELCVLINPTSTINWFPYNTHTWTIPHEARGSLYVFLTLLATHKMKYQPRMILISFLVIWFLAYAAHHISTFLSGIVLAELDLLTDSERPKWDWLMWLKRYRTPLLMGLLVFALHLGGQPALAWGPIKPQDYLDTPGYYYLGTMIPIDFLGRLQEYWYSIGAIIIVFVVSHLPFLKSLFEMRFAQYLGRISFGFYLVHGPVMVYLGNRMYAAVGIRTEDARHLAAWNNIWKFGHVGPVGLELSFVLCHVILLPLTFYLAELCTKLIDEPSVRLARHLYQKTMA